MTPVNARKESSIHPGRCRRGLAIIVLAATAATAQAAPPAVASAEPTVQRPATPSRLATRSLMLDIARCGERLLAVGERGRVLLSDDAGRNWRQARQVPVSVTLTAVQCADASRGWAVGHAGTVLRTDDAGETWTQQLDGATAARLALRAAEASPADTDARRNADQLVADGPDKPFLALAFTSPTHGLVVGAYGLVFSTDDGGATWRSRIADTDNPKGLHLNAVRRIGDHTWIAGEKGLLLRADESSSAGDAGSSPATRFKALKSPYDGSWFALDALPDGSVVLAGLRGTVFVQDGGPTTAGADPGWQKIDLPGTATVLASKSIDAGRLVLVAQDGAAYVLGADRNVGRLVLPPGAPPTAIAQAGDATLVASTWRGPSRESAAAPVVVAAAAR